MISLVQTLNHWGGQALTFAWPMLWQSSVLIAVLFVLDLALRAKRALPAPALLREMAATTFSQAKLPRRVRIKLTEPPFSPAVCGLFRPVILLPTALVARLAPAQLRAVLLHESFHIRRGDVW